MLIGYHNQILLVSYITTLTTIVRFRSSQRLLRTSNFCSALSPGSEKISSRRLLGFGPIPQTFSSSTTKSASPSPSLFMTTHEQTQAPRNRVHLNHAGASPSPQRVIDRLFSHLQLEQDDGGYAAQNAVEESGELDKVYGDIAKLIHSKYIQTTENDDDSSVSSSLAATTTPEIALVESATVGWTRAFYAMMQRDEQERIARFKRNGNLPSSETRVILISEAEYAANVVAACQWARDHDDHWMVLAIPSSKSENGDSTGMVDLEIFDTILNGMFCYENKSGEEVCLDPSSIAIVCVTHVPTNSGIVNPVEGIGRRIFTYNKRQLQTDVEESYLHSIKYLVDACQSVGQMDVNVQEIKCDALVATGRKYLRGPRGTGFLYISNAILAQQIIPSHIDHYGCPVLRVPSSSVYEATVQLQNNSVIEFAPREGAKRFEFWESNIAGRLGLGAAVCVAMEKGLPQISHEIRHLSALLRKELEETIPNIYIHHKESTICGITTFSCENVDARLIQTNMWNEGFELSMVPATSTPLDSSTTTVKDLVRASISYTTTEKDIKSFCRSLDSFLRETKAN